MCKYGHIYIYMCTVLLVSFSGITFCVRFGDIGESALLVFQLLSAVPRGFALEASRLECKRHLWFRVKGFGFKVQGLGFRGFLVLLG